MVHLSYISHSHCTGFLILSFLDCSPVTDANPLASKSIQEVRDFHIYHRLRTAITRSTYIFPLHYLGFRPWSPSGFTVAVWINPQSNSRYSGAASQSSGFGGSSSLRSEPFMSNSSPIKQTLPCSANCSWDEKVYTHNLYNNDNNDFFSDSFGICRIESIVAQHLLPLA